MKPLIDIIYIGVTIGVTAFMWRLCRELRDERDQ